MTTIIVFDSSNLQHKQERSNDNVDIFHPWGTISGENKKKNKYV